MNKFKILLAMQLKEKLNLTFLKSKKQTLFKLVFSLLGFFVVAASAYIMLYLCQRLNLFSVSTRIPISVMAYVLTIILALQLVTCTIGLSRTLFYSVDNQVLVTFPVKANYIYLTKMIVYYISEIKRTFSFLVPMFFAYGFVSHLPFIFYIWSAVMLAVITAIPVLVGGILAIPTMFVIAFFKKFPIIKFLFLTVLLAILIFVVIRLIGLIPSDIDLITSWRAVSRWIRSMLRWATTNLYPFYLVCLFLCGKQTFASTKFFTNYSWQVLLVLLGIILVGIILNVLISRPIYLKLISKQFEFKRKEVKIQKHNINRGRFFAISSYGTKRTIRDISILSNTVLTLIVAPITILLLNRIYAAISTKLMGDYLTIAFNVLIISLFALSHNIRVASIYSRDGDALIISKTHPATPMMTMLPRLAYYFISTTLIVCLSVIGFLSNSILSPVNATYLTFAILFLAYAHIIWSADIDFGKPYVALFRTEGDSATSPNETKSTILTFAISAIFTGIVILFLIKAATNVWLKMLVFSFAFFALRVLLFRKKLNVLYKEM